MAGTITSGFLESARQEMAMGIHDFSVTYANVTVTNSSAAVTLTGIAVGDIVKFRVGAVVTGTNVYSTGVVRIATIDSTTQVSMTQTSTAAITQVTITGDTFKLALLKSTTGTTSVSQNYSRSAITNVGTLGTGAASSTNVGTDEVSGTGYTAGGQALTNVSPAITNGSGAYWTPSANIAWTTATFTAGGCVVYNASTYPKYGNGTSTTANAGGSAYGRAISVHSFGGDQTATSGTFTVVMPTNAFATAMFAIG